jgi:hypothetical protein
MTEPASSPKSPVWFAAVGPVLFGTTLLCVLAVLPAAIRCISGTTALSTGLGAWLVLWGLAASLMGPMTLLLHASKPWPKLSWSVPLGILFALPPFTMLGGILHRSTHHRPLGAATFALLGAVVLLGLVGLTARLVTWSGTSERRQWLGATFLALAGGAAVLAEVLWVRSAMRQAGPHHLGGLLVDGGLVVLVAAAGVSMPVQIVRIPRWLGPSLWLVVVGVSAILITASPAVRGVVSTHAPLVVGFVTCLPER